MAAEQRRQRQGRPLRIEQAAIGAVNRIPAVGPLDLLVLALVRIAIQMQLDRIGMLDVVQLRGTPQFALQQIADLVPDLDCHRHHHHGAGNDNADRQPQTDPQQQ